MTSPSGGNQLPITLGVIKSVVYGGRKGFGPGLRLGGSYHFDWEFRPSVEIIARDMFVLDKQLQDYTVPLKDAIRKVMVPSIKYNFSVEGRPPWPRLSLRAEQIRGSARPILWRTGALEDAATNPNIWTVTKTSATVKRLPPNVWYGALHQEGYGDLRTRALQELARLFPGRTPTKKAVQTMATELSMISEETGRGSKFAIPQRKFIMMQDEDADDIQEIFVDWLEKLVNEAGRGWTSP